MGVNCSYLLQTGLCITQAHLQQILKGLFTFNYTSNDWVQNNTFVVLLIITTNQFEILVELNVIVHKINPSADLNSSEIPPLWLSGMSDMDSANLTNITVKIFNFGLNISLESCILNPKSKICKVFRILRTKDWLRRQKH